MNHLNQQKAPKLYNQFKSDDGKIVILLVLQTYLVKFIPIDILKEIWADLYRFGEKCGREYPKYSEESERFKPILEKYDAWGKYYIII